MNQITEEDIIILKDIRETYLDRIDVLKKVGTLALIPNTEWASGKQVANFYNVTPSTIRTLVGSNRDEFIEAGYTYVKGADLIAMVDEQAKVEKKVGHFLINSESYAINVNGVFPKRAVLLVGMLLTDSEVAKQVRTYLLDVEQIAHEKAPEVIHEAVTLIDDEVTIKAQFVDALLEGDITLAASLLTEVKLLDKLAKDKRVQVLTAEKEVLLETHQNLMAQYELSEKERELLASKMNYICTRTANMNDRKELCHDIIKAYGLKEHGSVEKGYEVIQYALLEGFDINLYQRKTPLSTEPLINYLNIAEFTLLETLLRKLVITNDLKDFYLN